MHQYDWLREEWVTHSFTTREKAVKFVERYRLMGWPSSYVYLDEEKGEKVREIKVRDIEALGGTGILWPKDLEDFRAAEQRVALLMSDGKWHTGDEIRVAAGTYGNPASEGLRRFRTVRAKLTPKGYEFDRMRTGDGRDFRYRMTRAYNSDKLF